MRRHLLLRDADLLVEAPELRHGKLHLELCFEGIRPCPETETDLLSQPLRVRRPDFLLVGELLRWLLAAAAPLDVLQLRGCSLGDAKDPLDATHGGLQNLRCFFEAPFAALCLVHWCLASQLRPATVLVQQEQLTKSCRGHQPEHLQDVHDVGTVLHAQCFTHVAF